MRRLSPTAVVGVTVAMIALTLAQPLSAQPSGLSMPVTGTGPTSAFTGTFTILRFASEDGVVEAVGVVSGTVVTATGTVGTIVKTIAVPVTIGQTSCDILHLELGPISLDLLGLQIDLNQIVLDIDAQAGAGNLLGNLLCAVAGLLDNPGGLARLLNQILNILA